MTLGRWSCLDPRYKNASLPRASILSTTTIEVQIPTAKAVDSLSGLFPQIPQQPAAWCGERNSRPCTDDICTQEGILEGLEAERIALGNLPQITQTAEMYVKMGRL